MCEIYMYTLEYTKSRPKLYTFDNRRNYELLTIGNAFLVPLYRVHIKI